MQIDKNFKRRIFFILLALLVLLSSILSACAPSADQPPEQTDAGKTTQETGDLPSGDNGKLTVGQTGKGIKAAMVVLALESGFFEEEGVDVELVQIQNLNDGITAVSQNKLDVLPLGIIPSVTYISQGSDLVIFGGTITEGSEAICRPEDAEKYQTLESLEGLKITCVRPETGHMFVQDYLTQNNIEGVEWIELDNFQSGIESVKKETADFGFVNSGFGYNAVKQRLVVPFAVADFFPRNVCCRQTTSREVYETKRESLIRFQMANLRAYDFAYGNDEANREETIERLASYSELEPEYVDYCIYSGVMKYELDPATDRVRDFYELMERDGQISPEDSIDFEQHMDLSIYREALTRLIERYPDNSVYTDLLDLIERDNTVFISNNK